MKFNRIVAVDNTGLVENARLKLKDLALEAVFYNDYPKDKEEILSRIADADCLLVSWNTVIDSEIIEGAKGLKYIGMCCSLYDEASANVDIAAAREAGITVLGVRDYGDEGVIEFIIGELTRLLHGFGEQQWRADSLELTGQRLGIIGMGTLGSMLAEKAQAFGMEVNYYNRSRRPQLEDKGVKYLELKALLQESDIISTHLPRNSKLIGAEEFRLLGNGKILINTSLGPTFDVEAFKSWISQEGNFAIFDRVAMGNYYEAFKEYKRVIYTDKVAGWTAQAKERLSFKVLDNMVGYLNK